MIYFLCIIYLFKLNSRFATFYPQLLINYQNGYVFDLVLGLSGEVEVNLNGTLKIIFLK